MRTSQELTDGAVVIVPGNGLPASGFSGLFCVMPMVAVGTPRMLLMVGRSVAKRAVGVATLVVVTESGKEMMARTEDRQQRKKR